MRNYLVFIFLVHNIVLTAQTANPLHISELAFHTGIYGGKINNPSVKDAISKNIQNDKWDEESNINKELVGVVIGFTAGLSKNIKIDLSQDYVSALAVSTPGDNSNWSGDFTDEVNYLYRRWSTNLLFQYHHELFKRFSLYAAAGPNYDKIILKKRSALYNFLTLVYKPDSSITMARTNTFGIRMAIGANYKITSKFGLELNIFKDILNPRTSHNIKLDYNLCAVELKFKMYFRNFPKKRYITDQTY
jgi:outer membrane protein W